MSIARNTVETLRTTVVDADIGSTVQGYDADTAKLDAAANFTQALQNGGSNVVVDTDIGTTVLAPNGDGSSLTGIDALPTQTSQSGKFLTTNGSAASWGAVAASGMTLLSTVTASSSATVDIETTFDSTYDAYVLLVTALKTSSNTTIKGRVKIGSYITTASTYLYHLGECTTTNGGYIGVAFSTGAGKTDFEFTNNIGTGADHSVDLRINIFDPSSTSTAKKLFWEGISKTSGNELARISGGGGNTNTGALTGIRFFPGAGTITSGTFRLYGITNS